MSMDDREKKQGREAVARALLGIAPTAEQYRLIGQFFHEFSQAEFSLRFMLSRLAGIPDELFDIITAPYDTNALCNVVKAVAKRSVKPEVAAPLIDIVNQFQKLNGERVRIAHGTWSDSDEGLISRHVSRTSLEPDWYYGRAEELEKLIAIAKNLQERILVTGLDVKSDMDATRAAEA